MRRISILVVVFSFLLFPAGAKTGRLLWSKATSWGGTIRVRQLGDVRTLLFADGGKETEESRMLVKRPDDPQLAYVRQMLAVTALWEASQPKPDPDFYVVGLGAGSLSKALARLFPGGTVTSAELEPAVVEAARRYFLYKESSRILTVIDDARHDLEKSSAKYDVIFLDAFDGREVPEPLRTVEFAELLEKRLKPGGAVIANIHYVPQEAGLRYQKSLLEVFPHRYLADGLAQGVGIFSHEPQGAPAGIDPQRGARYGLPLANLLREAPSTNLENVTPFHDRQP